MRSGDLPIQLEEEVLKEAITKITNPSTTLYSTLLERLFSEPVDPRVIIDPIHSPNHTIVDTVAVETILNYATLLCRRHCAVYLETPLLLPRSVLAALPGNQWSRAMMVMDEQGIVMASAMDLTLPFARYVVKHNINSLRRYSLGKVYRKEMGGHIREATQMSFDVVFPLTSVSTTDLSFDAECVKVFDGIHELYGGAGYRVVVNHRGLFEAILNLCGIDDLSYWRGLFEGYSKLSWAQIHGKLLTEESVDKEILDPLCFYFETVQGLRILLFFPNIKRVGRENDKIGFSIKKVSQGSRGSIGVKNIF